MAEISGTALDKLIRTSPGQVANFALSSNVTRNSVTSAGEALMLLPQRGAMPIFWSADGYPDEERGIKAGPALQLPIGSFDFQTPEGQVRDGTLNREQKRSLVGQHRQVIRDADRVLLIDEVQKGGTISELVGIVEGLRSNPQGRLLIVAAQDSRKRVAAEQKRPEYTRLATGGVDSVSTTVIPMPLFGTDSASLLDQLWYHGKTRIPAERVPEIEIVPNPEAELIFRVLGMAARNREALEDTSVLDTKLFSLPSNAEATQRRMEQWRHRLLDLLKSRVH